jgi:hypothetical protein
VFAQCELGFIDFSLEEFSEFNLIGPAVSVAVVFVTGLHAKFIFKTHFMVSVFTV